MPFEKPFDPRKMSRRERDILRRDLTSTVASAYQARETSMERFMGAINADYPSPEEIEDTRFRYLTACEAHADALIGLRGVLITFKRDRGRGG
ncbi:hypothetical protein [Candidatus Macondimonas diazotrophica]|jgi:hypothetical protein|uniref:Uncharacterized protein n=1 Tax=Candidatus Macondimonas diazotrophica TaxID=2305248 RepID=A0A4Z0F7B5_9GAMM|nr:hypothetical protein [Candidatus Macondimonas diazotrophica]TFZ81292.1 hypothetical protein E4680_13070 [Candidatus Macondimonas diazotrophica]